MAATVTVPITNTTDYPVYATKAAFMADMWHAHKMRNRDQMYHALCRLSNTDTDNWTAASTARHDA